MKFLLSLALYTVVISCNQKSPLDQIDPKPLTENLETQRPKNIILVIGDGTGINQISSLEFYKEGEPSSGWVHCSYSTDLNKKESLIAYREDGKVKYKPWS